MKMNSKNSSRSRFPNRFTNANPCSIRTGVTCLLFIGMISCTSKNAEEPVKVDKGRKVAKVYDKDIYFSDLKPYINRDSATLVNAYLDQVAREEALLRKAKDLSKLDLEEVEEKTTRFRNSLLVLRYQQAYLKEKLDTNVTSEEIKQYYHQNSAAMVTDQDIFIGYYVKIPLSTPRIGRLKDLMASDKPNDFHELKSICLRYASVFMIEGKAWGPMPSIFKNSNKLHEQPISHLVQNRVVLSIEKDDDLHLIRLFDFKFAKQPSPVAYAEDKIKKNVLTKRRSQLLNKLNAELLNEAKTNNHIEIY